MIVAIDVDMSAPSRSRKSSKKTARRIRRKARVMARKAWSRKAEARRARRTKIRPTNVQGFVNGLFGEDLHAKRVLSLANAVTGVLHAAVLAVHAIGQAYAKLAGITPKSGVKQVDRLLSNEGIVLAQVFKWWVSFVVGVRKEIVIALDWTEFDKDDHSTLAAYLITRHGRATPLVWRSVPEVYLEG